MAFATQQDFLSINLLNNSVAALINNNLRKPFNIPIASKTDNQLESEDDSEDFSTHEAAYEFIHENVGDADQEKLSKIPVNQIVAQYLDIQNSLKAKSQNFRILSEQYIRLRSEYNDFFLDCVDQMDDDQFYAKDDILMENDRLKAENSNLCNQVYQLTMTCENKINELESLASEHDLIKQQVDIFLQSSTAATDDAMATKLKQLSDEVLSYRKNAAKEQEFKSKYEGLLEEVKANSEYKMQLDASENVIHSYEEDKRNYTKQIECLQLEIQRKNELLVAAKNHFCLVENMEQKLINLEEKYSSQLLVQTNLNDKRDIYEDLLKDIRHAIHFTMMLLQEGVRMSDNLKQEIGDLRHQIIARELCDKSMNTTENILEIDKANSIEQLLHEDGNNVSSVTDLNEIEGKFVSNLAATNCKPNEEYNILAVKYDELSLERENLKKDILAQSDLYVKQELNLYLQLNKLTKEKSAVMSTNESLVAQLQQRNKRLYSLQRKLIQNNVVTRLKIKYNSKLKLFLTKYSKLKSSNKMLIKQLDERERQIARLTPKIVSDSEKSAIDTRLEMDNLLMENKSLKWLNSNLNNQLGECFAKINTAEELAKNKLCDCSSKLDLMDDPKNIQNAKILEKNEKEKLIIELNDKHRNYKLVIQENSELKALRNDLQLNIQSLSEEIALLREKEREWFCATEKFVKERRDDEPNPINLLTQENTDLKEIIKSMQEGIAMKQNPTHRSSFMPNKQCCESSKIFPINRGHVDGYNIPELLRICRTIIAKKGVFTLASSELNVIHRAIYTAALGKESISKTSQTASSFVDQQNRVEHLENTLLESKKILRKLSKPNGDLNIIINTPINCAQTQNLKNNVGERNATRKTLKRQ